MHILRLTIIKYERALSGISLLMVGYSLVFLILKIVDFSDINDRMARFQGQYINYGFLRSERIGRARQAQPEIMARSEKYMSLYYEVNFLSLITSLLAVFASLYINRSLKKTLILKKS